LLIIFIIHGCSSSDKGILIIYFSNNLSQHKNISEGRIYISDIKIFPENIIVSNELQSISLLPDTNEKSFLGNIELPLKNNYRIYIHLDKIEFVINNSRISPVMVFKNIKIGGTVNIKESTLNFITLELDLDKSLIFLNDKYFIFPCINIKNNGMTF
jgi:hypothetical protein